MTFDKDAFMEEGRLKAEKKLGRAIASDDWKTGAVIEPDDNAFAKLGLPDSAERGAKQMLARSIRSIMRDRDLKQTQVAELTKLSQSDVSKILRGQLRGFSEARLCEVIAALGFDVRRRIEIIARPDHAAGRVELIQA